MQHGGAVLEKYDWSEVSSDKAQRMKEQYRSWCNRIDAKVKKDRIRTLDIKNIWQFNIQDCSTPYNENRRRAHISMAKFEFDMKQSRTLVCGSCKQWCFLNRFKEGYICNACRTGKYSEKDFVDDNLQPIWFNDANEIQWMLPSVLDDLSLQEELILQRSAPYVPVIHIYKGSLGIKGHCVVFEKEAACNIEEIDNCNSGIIHFNRQYGCASSGREHQQMFIKVRKDKVLDAFRFLNKRHSSYHNLSFSDLPKVVINDNVTNVSESLKEDDSKISSSYCHDAPSSAITYSSADIHHPAVTSSKNNKMLLDELKGTAKKHNCNIPVLSFPPTKEQPIR